jgi:signal transduction histidine kinase
MSSKIAEQAFRSAAWRISLWATLAFALGTLAVFVFLHSFVARDIQRRSDAWLSGEVEVLGDVAERTPKDALYGRVVGEVAELAGKEVPNRQPGSTDLNDSVFFLQILPDGSPGIWVGQGDRGVYFQAIRAVHAASDKQADVRIPGIPVPYRVAADRTDDGSIIYLGLSERDELHVLRDLRLRFTVLWAVLVLLGYAIVFSATRRMLGRVRNIAQAASRIGRDDLSTRVPAAGHNDEIGQLASTLNRMLDHIEQTVGQLHTMTDSLAHDLRSPITAIRGRLESSLTAEDDSDRGEAIVSAIDLLDRLTEFLNTSLDVAEARAGALRLNPAEINFEELLRSMIDLYEPSMTEKGIHIVLRTAGPLRLSVDAALMHRMVANLLDNELRHLRPSSSVQVDLQLHDGQAILTLADDGPGFEESLLPHLFERRIRGRESNGHGLGLAFVDAVARAHGGAATGCNRPDGGALIRIALPVVASPHPG